MQQLSLTALSQECYLHAPSKSTAPPRPYVCSCLQCGIPGAATVMSVSLVDVVAGQRKLTGASVGGRADVKVKGSAGCSWWHHTLSNAIGNVSSAAHGWTGACWSHCYP